MRFAIIVSLLLSGSTLSTAQAPCDSVCLNILTSRLSTANADIDSILMRLEEGMIKGRYFKDHSSRNFIYALNLIKADDNIEFGQWEISNTDLQTLINLNIKYPELDSNLLHQALSDTSSYIYKRNSIYDEISAYQDIRPSNIVTSLLRYWTVSDFDSKLYRITFFKLLSGIHNPNEGLKIKLPNHYDSLIMESSYNTVVIDILVDSMDIVHIKGEIVKLPKVKKIVKEFLNMTMYSETGDALIEEHTNKIISFKNERGTSYKAYVSVYNEIIIAYNEVRDERSKELYNTSFSDLSRVKQNEIRKLIPMRISEAEPIGD